MARWIDEAQFLTPEQVDQALAIAVLDEIPVVAFGIRTDFRTGLFRQPAPDGSGAFAAGDEDHLPMRE